MEKYQDTLHTMLTWFLSPKSRGLELVDGFHTVRMVSQNISLGYQNLFAIEGERIIKTLSIPDIDEEEYSSKDEGYLRPVIEIRKYAKNYLRDYLDSFLIHGSIATLDYSVGWSDLDTYLILSKETILDSSRLVELRDRLLHAYSYLLRIDPLQHHGFLLCTASDLEQYPSPFMPVNVLKYSKSLLGDCQITFYILPESLRRKDAFRKHLYFFKKTYETGILKHHAYNGEYLLDNFQNRENAMYQMKNFLEFVTILPAYFLEAQGKPCYKRESFDLVKPHVPSENWELIEKVSFLRMEWQNRETHPYVGNKIPDWLIRGLEDNYFKRMYELVKVLWEQLKTGA